MNTTNAAAIVAHLATKNLRPAGYNEAGWYVLVPTDDGPRRIWATDDVTNPADPDDVTSCLDYRVPVMRTA